MRGQVSSCGLAPDQHFRRRGDIRHHLRRRLQIPVGVPDIGMAQIGRERDEVPGDLAPLGPALFQHPGCEGMAKIVDAWLAAALGRDPCSSQRQRKV